MSETPDPGRNALEAMDQVLAKRPITDGEVLTRATLCLAELRERITPADWASAPRDEQERLARLNSIISVVMGLHFPLGPPPWGEFEKARDWLAGLLADLPQPAGGAS